MTDAIMTFGNPFPVGQAPNVVIHVGIEGATVGATDKIIMPIDYNTETRGMHVLGIRKKMPCTGGFVKTPVGLVKQANAYFKQIYGDTPDTPVLHIKSFRFYADRTSYPFNVRDYEVQDLTRLQDIFDLIVSNGQIVGNFSAGNQVPTSCTVLRSHVYFYNVYGYPANSPAGVDVSHGEQAFRDSMIANGFKLIP